MKKMNILHTIDNNFVPQYAAGVCAICENNKKADKINFFLFALNVSKTNIKKLQELVKSYNRKLTVIEIDSIDQYFDFEFDSNGWAKVTLARLLIGQLIDKKVDRILYLDGDTIVRGDLTKLWNTDLNGKVIGMSIEPTTDRHRISSLGLKEYPYYNAGVLLIDLKKWREENIQEKIFSFSKEYQHNLYAPDQDAINGALKDEIYTISPKYNYYNIFDQYPYKFLCKLMHPCKYISKTTFDKARKNPVIVHYLGEERPWRKGNTHKYKEDYKKYLAMTYWKDTKDEDGWEFYFLCWRLFNTITKPFPGIRYKIITSLIPSFIKYRKKKLKSKK